MDITHRNMLLFMHIFYIFLNMWNRTLDCFKRTFEPYTTSTFRFPKFHLTTHYVETIREYGSLHTVSTAMGEKNHKVQVKPAHRRTSQKRATAQSELADKLEMGQTCRSLVRAFHIKLPRTLPLDEEGKENEEEEKKDEEQQPSHTFVGKKFEMFSYTSGDVNAGFRFPEHAEAFAG